MRLTQLFGMSMSLSFVLAACGSDGTKKPNIIDAPAGHMDAAPDAPHMCLLPASIAMGSLGTMAMPRSGNFIINDPQAGTFFGLKLFLDAGMKTGITIIVPKPMTGGFTAGDYAFDGNAGLAFLEGGLDSSGMNATQELDATGGKITFTAIGQNAGNPITASMGSTMFAEVDTMGNPVTGGCTSTVAGLKLFLSQMTTVPAPTGPGNHGNRETWMLQVNNLPAQIYTVD